jgi:hypothetical protein
VATYGLRGDSLLELSGGRINANIPGHVYDIVRNDSLRKDGKRCGGVLGRDDRATAEGA